jgi:GTP-binding nuclear protein Ran
MISNPRLEFVAAPALAPAEVAIDPLLMKRYEDELKQVSVIANLSCLI